MEIAKHHIIIGSATDTGKVRDHNEDFMAHFETLWGYCVVVCDGMGGHNAGEVASQTAVQHIKQYFQNSKTTHIDIGHSLSRAFEFANEKLRELSSQKTQLKGMGTTCVLAMIYNGELNIAHAGDSRIYLVRHNEIEQLTKDHSVVQVLIDKGTMTEKEAKMSDRKNEITKAIGIFARVSPSVSEKSIALFKDDKILLCSDGLTEHLNNEEICETVNKIGDDQQAALKLVEMANEDGGTDNITVQIVHYTG